MKSPPLWLSLFGLSSILVILITFIFIQITSQNSNLKKSSWATYENSKYNFEFKYPTKIKPNPQITGDESLISFSLINPQFYGNVLDVYKINSEPNTDTISQYYQKLSKNCKRGEMNMMAALDFCDLPPNNIYDQKGIMSKNAGLEIINDIDFIFQKEIIVDGSCGPYQSASWKLKNDVFIMYFVPCLYYQPYDYANINDVPDYVSNDSAGYFKQILSTLKFSKSITPSPQPGSFCGGIAGLPCPSGFTCQLDGNYPDAGGTCIKQL